MANGPFSDIAHDESGSVIVEAAFVLPILVTVILGLISYASWFLTAHNVQSAANDAARAAMAGLNGTERAQLVGESIGKSIIRSTAPDPTKLDVETELDGAYFTVTVTYDGSETLINPASLLPMPSSPIERSAVVRLVSILGERL